jgi:hypothetical protein
MALESIVTQCDVFDIQELFSRLVLYFGDRRSCVFIRSTNSFSETLSAVAVLIFRTP